MGELTQFFFAAPKFTLFLQFCTVKLIFFACVSKKNLQKRAKLANLGELTFEKIIEGELTLIPPLRGGVINYNSPVTD